MKGFTTRSYLWSLLDEKGVLFGILANVNFGGREDDIYLDIPDGLETTEVPRVLLRVSSEDTQQI